MLKECGAEDRSPTTLVARSALGSLRDLSSEALAKEEAAAQERLKTKAQKKIPRAFARGIFFP